MPKNEVSSESEKVRDCEKLSSLIFKAWKWELLDCRWAYFWKIGFKFFCKINKNLKKTKKGCWQFHVITRRRVLCPAKSFFPYQRVMYCEHNAYLWLFLLQFSANYDPNEDEYYRANGHVMNGAATLDNNNQPITVQPSARIRHNSTSRCSKFL